MAHFTHDGRDVVTDVSALVVAGWTGRDAQAVDHHVQELAALGVAPPSQIPLFYRTSSSLLDAHRRIEVVGSETSGEVEPLVIVANGQRWLGLASDHTDRALEAHSVALSKQICAKPCASAVWPMDEIVDRLDTLEMRSWIADAQTFERDPHGDAGDGEWTLYQEGTLATLRPLTELMSNCPVAAGNSTCWAMLCGTLPAIGGVRAAEAFRMELLDPQSGRRLQHAYRIDSLPAVN